LIPDERRAYQEWTGMNRNGQEWTGKAKMAEGSVTLDEQVFNN
jgi:hypothetical protein